MADDPTSDPAQNSGDACPSTTGDNQLATTGNRAILDAHGFDPNDYDWVPVRRQPRPDGWSEEKQRLFIATLADTGSVTQAARAVGKSTKSAYELRRAPDGGGFDRAWTAAVRQGMNRLLDACLERAVDGTQEAIYDKDGRVLGMRTKYHDRMAMFLLRAHMPELFGQTGQPVEPAAAASESVPIPIAEAVQRLDPVPPAEPHKLMGPGDLQTALDMADLSGGALPRRHRDPDLIELPDDDPLRAGLGEQFERDLEAAKAGTYRSPRRKGRRGRI